MNDDTILNEARKILIKRIIDNTIEMLEIEYKDDEQAWLDNLSEILLDEHNDVMRYNFELSFDRMENAIKWHIGNKFNDEHLINELIEDQIAEGEHQLDEYLKSLE